MKASHFDYIIIGGGSAGCVLANRLSADPKISVCLIEAGPKDSNPFIHMPLGIVAVIRSKILNWKFWTVKQKHLADRTIYWPRGRTLGGSSAINAMCYIRGNPKDYDGWEKLGNKGWSYQEILPYFQKMENFESGASEYHWQGGPLNVAKHRHINHLETMFIDAAKEAGFTYNEDFNGKQQEGVGYYHVMQINGQRCSNARAYLYPILQRQNLIIITNALVTKILVVDKHAVAVTYKQKNIDYELFANKEIILSAGAIGSPHILLLSGIGPRVEVEKHQIPFVHDLPGVGENLQDHLDIHICCLEKTRHAFSFHFRSLWRNLKNIWNYIFKHTGELTINYTQAGGFFKSDSEESIPNMQWHFAPSIYTNSGINILPLFKHYGYTLMTCHLQPKSRGKITLKSSDPKEAPMIDPNYLDDQEDLNVLVKGFKISREILRQKAFEPYFESELEPGNKVQSDAEIETYIRQSAQTIYHPVGTCKMGNDALAVVDAELKVHGINGLRIIDASIMPTIISGNTNAAVTMIAEKGADMILQSQQH